jgi:GTPase SAR1 family protein
MIASPSMDGTIRVWNTLSGDLLWATPDMQCGWVYCVAWSFDGQTFASGYHNGTICLWNAKTGNLVRKLKGHRDRVFCVSWFPPGAVFASGSADNTICLWDAESERQITSHIAHQSGINDLAWSLDGKRLASGSYDQRTRMWNVEGMRLGWDRLIWDKRGHAGSVSRLAWSADGTMIASGSEDKTVEIRNPDPGKRQVVLEGHTGTVTGVSFSADSQFLASKAKDGTVRLWRCGTWEIVATIEEPNSDWWAAGVTFHPKTMTLATLGEQDTVIRLWDLASGVESEISAPVPPTVIYTSAKIVLVGESNVGKSYLAHRITTGCRPEDGRIQSTHGMRFWPMEPERLSSAAGAPGGQRRDVVFWDMGGQEEYRLIHQLFLRDTTVALVLLDPKRGATAFKEVETWNRYLIKQLSGRQATKLLVGAKVDEPSDMIDRQGLEQLIKECGFAGYYETSALNGRGVPELCEAVAEGIDWDGLGTSRPELFQRLRDEIEAQRRRGEVLLYVKDLRRALSEQQPPIPEEAKAVDAVTEQLATQGVIARSRVSTGEPVLVLQVQELERYAGSLIVAARNNLRGVPVLEVNSIAQADFHLPGIAERDRLPRGQEKPVLECTVQLLLEHGICFQHEGLLVFPTLFPAAPAMADTALPHTVSLYYDFAGAIDNIYASLVAWLVLAQDFGRVRLWSDRAEFEAGKDGLCGLRKVTRTGGFAHVDVYFEATTPPASQELFISCVEEHLLLHGVEIQEHVAITCQCGHKFQEETLRQRIARGDKDVGCPDCDRRHNLEGVTESRERNPDLSQRTWALKTEVEKRRQETTEQAVQVMEKIADTKPAAGPIRLLHLSDLHFTAATPVSARLQWLLDDLKQDSGLDVQELNYLVISGDFTDRGCLEGFEKAYEFASGLTQEFGLSAERCIFVPGNHDVCDLQQAYDWREKSNGLKEDEWVRQGDVILVRNAEWYPLRFKPFSDNFYHKFLLKPYPEDYTAQGMTTSFWNTGLQFIMLNSCWQIDRFYRKRAGLLPEAVAHAIKQAQKQEETQKSGQLPQNKTLLRIAVWHHAVAGSEQIRNIDFLGNLQKNGVRLALHGDVHEMRRDLVGYWHQKRLHVVGSGSFGARAEDMPEAIPRLYNLLEISRDLKSARVHTRCQPRPDGPLEGWHTWPDPHGGKGKLSYFDIDWPISG